MTSRHNFLLRFFQIILLCLPGYLFRFSFFGIPTTFLEILIFIFFICFVWIYRKNIILEKRDFAVLFVVIVAFFAVFWSGNMRTGMGIWKAYFLEPAFLFVAILHIKPRLDDVLQPLGVLAIFSSAVASIQWITGYGIPTPWNIPGPEFRLTSVYEYPNALALMLAPILALFFGTSILQKKMNFFFGSVLTLGLITLWGTQAQGAFVGIFFATLFVFFFTRYRFFIPVFFIIALVMIFFLAPLKNTVFFQDVSGQVRLALWQGTVQLIQTYPFLGAGLGGFPEAYDFFRLPSHTELLLYPHNIFLDFWVELGIFGFIWILFVFGIIFFRKYKNISSENIILLGGFVCIFVYGLVDSTYFKNDLSALFWIFLGLLQARK